MRPPIDGATILITGASSGIGKAMAVQLAPRAGTLVIVARREERLDALRTALLKTTASADIRSMTCDLSEPAERFALLDRLALEVDPIDVLINCAGIGDQSTLTQSDNQKNDAMLAVNCEALTHLCRDLVPPMVERGTGGVLNVGSQLGLIVQPAMAVYSATKHYVDALSEAMRANLEGTGVVVTQLCPGPVRTEFAGVAGYAYTRGSARDRIAITPEQCAERGLAGFEAGRALVIPQPTLKAFVVLHGLLPRPLQRVIGKRMAKAASADQA